MTIRLPVSDVAMRPSIGAVMDGASRTANSFDAIRLGAAVAVLVSHAFVITFGSEHGDPLFAATGGMVGIGFVAVGIFFSISGFLIDRSWENSRSLVGFAVKRCLRILPGLWASLAVTTIFAAIVLASEGFRLFERSTTWNFLGNALLLPASALLPGVFDDRKLASVFNGSLWTLKHEVACYVVTVLLSIFGPFRRHALIVLWLAAVVVGNGTDAARASGALYYLFVFADLFQYFGLGMIISRYRHWILHSPTAALVLIAMWFAALATPFAREATPLLLTYPMIALGASPSRFAQWLTAGGDMSYGVYVYAFPVQQLMAPFQVAGLPPWLANILLSLPLCYGLAVLSWRFVERPALDLGSRLARRYDRAVGAQRGQ